MGKGAFGHLGAAKHARHFRNPVLPGQRFDPRDGAPGRLALADQKVAVGAGRELVLACLDEARRLGIRRVFALTYKQAFFEKLGFAVIEKSQLPHKIWGACMKCAKFPDCDEIALSIDLSVSP